MINKTIDEILETTNLLELADRLEIFHTQLNPSNQEEFLKQLLYELGSRHDFFAIIDDGPYQILDGEFEVNQYLYNALIECNSLEETKIFIKGHVDDIRSRVETPQGNRLSESDIRKMMTHLEDRFSFCEKLFQFDKLKIVLLNNSFTNMNSVYKALLMSNDSIYHSVFISHEMKNFGLPQAYTFFHELGHVLHTAITRSPLDVPSSFRNIQEIMFPASLNYSSEGVIEIFADCFAFVATMGTDLEAGNPLNSIHPDDKKILMQYFGGQYDKQSILLSL